MNIQQVQMLLTASKYYNGGIDGDAGPKTWAAVRIIEGNNVPRGRYIERPDQWPERRRLVAAGQLVLWAEGYDPGPIDGYAGHNTNNALAAWLHKRTTGKDEIVARQPIKAPVTASGQIVKTSAAQKKFPTQRNMIKFFGKPGSAICTMGRVLVPYPLKLSWEQSTQLTSFKCHDYVADTFTNVFRQTFDHYGIDEIVRLKLDLFGGCYNYRKMRGGKALSTHSFGIAIDLNPDENRLRWTAKRASFARAEYEPFMQIMVENGIVPAGYAWGKDWMHFQAARLR